MAESGTEEAWVQPTKTVKVELYDVVLEARGEGGGPYLDQAEAWTAETARALAEGRAPDPENAKGGGNVLVAAHHLSGLPTTEPIEVEGEVNISDAEAAAAEAAPAPTKTAAPKATTSSSS